MHGIPRVRAGCALVSLCLCLGCGHEGMTAESLEGLAAEYVGEWELARGTKTTDCGAGVMQEDLMNPHHMQVEHGESGQVVFYLPLGPTMEKEEAPCQLVFNVGGHNARLNGEQSCAFDRNNETWHSATATLWPPGLIIDAEFTRADGCALAVHPGYIQLR
jgi:hypothetical protein